MIRILVVDDHEVVRLGLQSALDSAEDFRIVGEAATADEAIAETRSARPDVVLMDVRLGPGEDTGGIDACRTIRSELPEVTVLMFSSFSDRDAVLASIMAGAAGYLLKDAQPQELALAIRTVHSGEALLHPSIAAKLMHEYAEDESRGKKDVLTPRELEVLRHLARGMSNKEIAKSLVLSEKTVKTHVSNILQKLDLADRTQAALYAVRHGLADLE